jgi:hypothetical protein
MNRLSLRNNRLKFKTVGRLPTILEKFRGIYPKCFNKGKPKDVNMYPVGLANTRISTDYDAQKSPRSLVTILFLFWRFLGCKLTGLPEIKTACAFKLHNQHKCIMFIKEDVLYTVHLDMLVPTF